MWQAVLLLAAMSTNQADKGPLAFIDTAFENLFFGGLLVVDLPPPAASTGAVNMVAATRAAAIFLNMTLSFRVFRSATARTKFESVDLLDAVCKEVAMNSC